MKQAYFRMGRELSPCFCDTHRKDGMVNATALWVQSWDVRMVTLSKYTKGKLLNNLRLTEHLQPTEHDI